MSSSSVLVAFSPGTPSMARDVRANAMRVISRVVSSILLILSIRTSVRMFSGLVCPDERNICGRLPYVKR